MEWGLAKGVWSATVHGYTVNGAIAGDAWPPGNPSWFAVISPGELHVFHPCPNDNGKVHSKFQCCAAQTVSFTSHAELILCDAVAIYPDYWVLSSYRLAVRSMKVLQQSNFTVSSTFQIVADVAASGDTHLVFACKGRTLRAMLVDSGGAMLDTSFVQMSTQWVGLPYVPLVQRCGQSVRLYAPCGMSSFTANLPLALGLLLWNSTLYGGSQQARSIVYCADGVDVITNQWQLENQRHIMTIRQSDYQIDGGMHATTYCDTKIFPGVPQHSSYACQTCSACRKLQLEMPEPACFCLRRVPNAGLVMLIGHRLQLPAELTTWIVAMIGVY